LVRATLLMSQVQVGLVGMSLELEVQRDARGGLTISMNRPSVGNAFDEQQILKLTDANVRVVLLRSIGKHFCAGADINYMQRMGKLSRDENLADAQALALLMKTLNEMSKPTIARIQGAAFGGGVGLACCCDIAIGDASTVFSLSEVKIGLVPATIAPYVIQAVGQRTARRLFLTNDTNVDTETAHAPAVAPVSESSRASANDANYQQLDLAVSKVIDSLLQNSPQAIATAKQVISKVGEGEATDETIDYTVQTIADIRESNEGREGVNAFLEKRSPSWKG